MYFIVMTSNVIQFLCLRAQNKAKICLLYIHLMLRPVERLVLWQFLSCIIFCSDLAPTFLVTVTLLQPCSDSALMFLVSVTMLQPCSDISNVFSHSVTTIMMLWPCSDVFSHKITILDIHSFNFCYAPSAPWSMPPFLVLWLTIKLLSLYILVANN